MVIVDKQYDRAEEAVGFLVQKNWPEHHKDWRGIVPKDLGLNLDDWLKLSRRMLNRYNDNNGSKAAMSDAARKPYLTQRLTMFVVALADL
jgi:hypothetical protein